MANPQHDHDHEQVVQDDPYARDSFSLRRMTNWQAGAIGVVAIVAVIALLTYAVV